MEDKIEKNEELWYEIPSTVYIAVGRRGQEPTSSDQCWLPNCDNHNQDELIPFAKEETKSDVNEDGSYFTCKKIKVKCMKCNGIFKFAIKEVFMKPPKDTKSSSDEESKTPDNSKEKAKSFMGLLYILDENDNNIGFVGYC